MKTYVEVKQHILSLGYKWFDKPYLLNFIWERTSYNATNIFDDWLHLCYNNEKGIGQILSIPATTKPGLKGSLLEPITYMGISGTAVIECGQYLEAWQFKDTFKEFSTYPYFRQIGKINYWRDGNKDRIIDKIQRQIAKLFGTHWHRMSGINKKGTFINNWSLGCMGAIEDEFERILPFVRRSVKSYGDKFTGTIVDSW